MAPKKGTKRPAAEAMTPEAKKLKEMLRGYGVTKTLYDGVVEGIQRADVAVSVREMLIAMLPQGLCVPLERRHEYQAAHVKMIEELLQGMNTGLESAVASGIAGVKEIEEAQVQLQKQLEEELRKLEEAASKEVEAKLRLAEVTRAVLGSKTALKEKETERSEGDKAFEEAKEEKMVIEKALLEEFKVLRDGSAEPPEARRCYEALAALAERIGFEASLLKALPTSILRPPTERGSFDAMVVTELAEGLARRVAQLTGLVERGAGAAKERLSGVEEAREAWEAQKLRQQEAAEVFESTRKAKKVAEMGKQDATKKVEQCEPDLRAAKTILKEAEADLEHFKNYNWACFEQLRSRSSPKEAPQSLEEAQQMEAAEAGA